LPGETGFLRKGRARIATGLFSIGVMSDDYLSKIFLFGKLNLHIIGTVFANIQNKPTASGICKYSGLALLTCITLQMVVFI